MTFEEFTRKNSCEYKGYSIGLGTISKNGECHWMFFHGLDEPKESAFAAGKAIIDEHEAKVAQDQ